MKRCRVVIKAFVAYALRRVIAAFHFLSSLNRLRRRFIFRAKWFIFEPFLADFKVGFDYGGNGNPLFLKKIGVWN